MGCCGKRKAPVNPAKASPVPTKNVKPTFTRKVNLCKVCGGNLRPHIAMDPSGKVKKVQWVCKSCGNPV